MSEVGAFMVMRFTIIVGLPSCAPCVFAPLEGMYHVYRECGDSLHADSVSAVIRAKEVKVLSSEVVRIKEEVGRQTFR